MTIAFKLFVILLMSSIWCELSGIRKALEKIEKGGGSEAIKEFAERLKAEFELETNYGVVVNFAVKLFRNTIDNLLEEMEGDTV